MSSVERAGVPLSTNTAVDAVAWGRAPRQEESGSVNRRIVCADGFAVSVQASYRHYAQDSHPDGGGPYWRGEDGVVYPFIAFEVGNPEAEPEPVDVWSEYDSGGVWARVPRQVVVDLLDAHGGAVAWEATR